MEYSSELDHFFSLHTLYAIQSDYMANYGIVFLLFVIAVFLLIPTFKIKLCERHNRKIINSISKYRLSNVAIKISLDETVYIDYLYLVPKGILILNVMKYNGIIFAGENIEQWTQLLNKKSYKFPNPLQDLEICESAIRSVVKECDVIGHIAFESNCQFPKGKPSNISLLHELQNELKFLNGDVNQHLIEKWDELKNSEVCYSNIKQNDLSILVKVENKSYTKAMGIIFLVLSLLLLAYQVAELNWFD